MTLTGRGQGAMLRLLRLFDASYDFESSKIYAEPSIEGLFRSGRTPATPLA